MNRRKKTDLKLNYTKNTALPDFIKQLSMRIHKNSCPQYSFGNIMVYTICACTFIFPDFLLLFFLFFKASKRDDIKIKHRQNSVINLLYKLFLRLIFVLIFVFVFSLFYHFFSLLHLHYWLELITFEMKIFIFSPTNGFEIKTERLKF